MGEEEGRSRGTVMTRRELLVMFGAGAALTQDHGGGDDFDATEHAPGWVDGGASDTGIFTRSPELRFFACPRGHRWKEKIAGFGGEMHLAFSAHEPEARSGSLCPFCLVEWADRNCGGVREEGRGVWEKGGE